MPRKRSAEDQKALEMVYEVAELFAIAFYETVRLAATGPHGPAKRKVVASYWRKVVDKIVEIAEMDD